MHFEKPKNATDYHIDAKCCHAGAMRSDYAGLRFSLHHGRLEQPSRVWRITPLPTTCCHKLPLYIMSMEVVIISKSKYEEMVGKLNRLSDRVNEILRKREGKRLSRWMDNQEVCQQLRISPRTLQTLRDNGTLAYSQIGHKIFYKPEDVQRIVRFVEDRRKDAAYRGCSI